MRGDDSMFAEVVCFCIHTRYQVFICADACSGSVSPDIKTVDSSA